MQATYDHTITHLVVLSSSQILFVKIAFASNTRRLLEGESGREEGEGRGEGKGGGGKRGRGTIGAKGGGGSLDVGV